MKEDATKLLADLLTGCMIPIHPIPLACLTMAVFDVVAFPFAVRESNRNKLSVTFVYGNDDHVLYYYVADADPASRYRQALSTLTHPFARETELAKCSSAKDCVERYMEEARMRASEVEHELLPEQEREFQESLEIAKELDEHRITREQALMRWWGRRLGL
ncbi:MAG TPA: hypothetical protein VNL14_17045 [Candidatus Acidoferrales bacterium]|nr:hypothetical protein [Candidatus Acidoferrales bacterium]